MKYKCLIVDHDDTMVDSTRLVHYVSFKESLKLLRPDMDISLEDFFNLSFKYGFFEMCKNYLKYNEEETKTQYDMWRILVAKITPDFYEDILEVVKEFIDNDGILVVVSHSEIHMIEKHYKEKTDIIPSKIYGFDSKYVKPSPKVVEEILKEFKLEKEEALVLDDLTDGYKMAKQAGVDFAWAGYSHNIKEQREYMESEKAFIVLNGEDLKKLIF